MIHIHIPPARDLHLHHLCLDLNGTICHGGALIPGVVERLHTLATTLAIHVITADTNGNAAKLLHHQPVTLHCIGPVSQGQAKREYVRHLGAASCAALGNGYNDRFMLQEAELAIALTGREGAAPEACGAADICISSITDALDLLLHTERIVATLRD